jgi:hypothetical protein
MHEPTEAGTDVLWSQEGDAWVGVPTSGSRRGCEVELLLRATEWHVEMSHAACGAFEREYIQAADADEAKARAADLLFAFQARIGRTDAV